MTLRMAMIVASAALPLLVGCQQRHQASQQMQRELRMQEDRIYQLEDWIRQYNEQLNSCRDENVSLRSSGSKPAAGDRRSPAKAPVKVSPFGDSEPKAPGIPEVELPPENTPPAELPAPKPAGNRGARRATPTNSTRQVRRDRSAIDSSRAATDRPAAQPEVLPENTAGAVAPAVALASAVEDNGPDNVRLSSYEVSQPKDNTPVRITLNKTLTAALNSDGKPGDEGIMMVVEPRNDAGELIPPAGQLSISVIDPAATSEEEARVGRWSFTSDETAKLYRRTTLGDGIQLNLLWQNRPPVHEHLELYARLTTPDGRKLQTRRKLDITLPTVTEPTPVEEPRRLKPEAAPDQPTLVPEPLNPTPQPSPDAQPADPFEILPVATALPKPAKDSAVAPPSPAPRTTTASTPVAAPLPTTAAAPAAAAVPTPVRTVVAPRPQPRKALPVRPPAEEQVEIPTEPGMAAVQESPPPASPPVQKPKWSPNRP